MAAAGGSLRAQQQQSQHSMSSVMPPVNSSAFISQSAADTHRLGAIDADNHFQVVIRNRGEGVHPIDIIQTRCALSSFPRPICMYRRQER